MLYNFYMNKKKKDFAIPHHKSAFGQKYFSNKGTNLWNNLSVEVKSSNSYEIFKKYINNTNTDF